MKSHKSDIFSYRYSCTQIRIHTHHTAAKDSYQIAISDRRYLSGAIWAKDSVLIAIAMLSDR